MVIPAIWNFLSENAFIVVVAVFVVYRVMAKSGPFPETGGRVVSVHDEAEFDQLLDKADADNKLLVADFYATWCPPCRSAAPVFGQLSTEFDCEFVKCDVDSCASISRREGITAMPTFKIYDSKKCVETIRGFQKTALISAICERGAARINRSAAMSSPVENKPKAS